MNEKERAILNFMRDVEVAAQRNFPVSVIDTNTPDGINVRSSDLELLEARGLVESPDDPIADKKTYWMTGRGMQAIIADDTARAVEETNENLSDLNEEIDSLNDNLESTNDSIRDLKKSNKSSSLVQIIFSMAIIAFSYLQLGDDIPSWIMLTIDFALIIIMLILIGKFIGSVKFHLERYRRSLAG